MPAAPASAEVSVATESIALRAFSALECVVGSSIPLSLDEITSHLGLPKPTVFRILNLLKDAGLLHRDAAKRFTSGPRLTAFAVDFPLEEHAELLEEWFWSRSFGSARKTCATTSPRRSS